jgi:hypothetical protein
MSKKHTYGGREGGLLGVADFIFWPFYSYNRNAQTFEQEHGQTHSILE